MALAAEAAELLEIFQWLTDEQSREIVNDEKEMKLVWQEIVDKQKRAGCHSRPLRSSLSEAPQPSALPLLLR